MRADAIRLPAGLQTTPLGVLLGGSGRREACLAPPAVPPTVTPPALLRPWPLPDQRAGPSPAAITGC